MLKRIFFIATALLLAGAAFSQDNVRVEMFGKDKGTIKFINQNGQDFVEALPLAKILKMQTSWFGKSGQLNIKNSGGYFAVLREGRNTASVNGKTEPIGATMFTKNGALFAPLSFFRHGSVSKVHGYDVNFENGKIIIENFFTLERIGAQSGADSSKIIFRQKNNLKKSITPRGSTNIEVFFPGAIVKRAESLRIKDKFIERAKISQQKDGVLVSIFLNPAGKFWDLYQASGSTLVFEAAAAKITPAVFEEPAPAAAAPVKRPTVLEDGDAIELGEDFYADTPQKPAIESARPQPVIKPSITPAPVIDKRPGKKSRPIRVVIDPGHGGKDPGAVRSGVREKELNLAVAKHLHDLLKKDKDFEVRITRDNDTFIPLGNRAKAANDFKADIFISIHTNAAKRASANGFEVYFRSDKASSAEAAETAALENEALEYEGKSAASVSFADLLLKSLASNEFMNESSKIAGHIRNAVAKESRAIGIPVYGTGAIKQANFYVLKGINSPSILIEMGYISNTADRKRLNNKTTHQKMAQSIKDGLTSYAKAEGWK